MSARCGPCDRAVINSLQHELTGYRGLPGCWITMRCGSDHWIIVEEVEGDLVIGKDGNTQSMRIVIDISQIAVVQQAL